jgi:hypothetical protein
VFTVPLPSSGCLFWLSYYNIVEYCRGHGIGGVSARNQEAELKTVLYIYEVGSINKVIPLIA